MSEPRSDPSPTDADNGGPAPFDHTDGWATDLEYVLLCAFGRTGDRELTARTLRLLLLRFGLPHWAARHVTATSPLLVRSGRRRYRLRPPTPGLAD